MSCCPRLGGNGGRREVGVAVKGQCQGSSWWWKYSVLYQDINIQSVRLYSSFARCYHWGRASQVVLVIKEPTCQCRRCKRHWFNPWVRKIPWRRECQPTPVLLPGKFHGQGSLVGLQSMGSQRVRHNWATERTQEIEPAPLKNPDHGPPPSD